MQLHFLTVISDSSGVRTPDSIPICNQMSLNHYHIPLQHVMADQAAEEPLP